MPGSHAGKSEIKKEEPRRIALKGFEPLVICSKSLYLI
jgi:hypothetical protein